MGIGRTVRYVINLHSQIEEPDGPEMDGFSAREKKAFVLAETIHPTQVATHGEHRAIPPVHNIESFVQAACGYPPEYDGAEITRLQGPYSVEVNVCIAVRLLDDKGKKKRKRTTKAVLIKYDSNEERTLPWIQREMCERVFPGGCKLEYQKMNFHFYFLYSLQSLPRRTCKW